ncbi:hypothetical protein [Mycobacteroides salmoniphilum]|uniref:hypothetical protein n=1 Tax=Mycobacteroides salmoniphilum TaxID=404941 RepID=UPI001066836A|nr:hypothetical protein [Mycobacteroides salmoniphilum]TDZ90732.1 hypothetical protein CCUG62472_03985 [Mycobacteroides salmoniphilum]
MKFTVPEPEKKTDRSIDGTATTLRTLDRDDVQSVALLHSQLNEQDRYLRFFTTNPKYVAALAESLTQ